MRSLYSEGVYVPFLNDQPRTAAVVQRANALGLQGKSHLSFERRLRAHRVDSHPASSPPCISKVLYPEERETCTRDFDPPDGFAAGDRLSVTLPLADRSHSLLTTPAARRCCYRSDGAWAPAECFFGWDPGLSRMGCPREYLSSARMYSIET